MSIDLSISNEEQEAPLSFPQRRVWFLQDLYGDNVMYNVAKSYHIIGALDAEAIRDTLRILALRHEQLRCRFRIAPDGSRFQVIEKDPQINIEHTDLRDKPENKRSVLSGRIVQEAVLRPFRLCDEHMLRIAYLRLTGSKSILLFVKHHLVTDYWSWRIFLAEFTSVYTALITGDRPSLPPLGLQYTDFARQQTMLLTEENLRGRREYWQGFFDGHKDSELMGGSGLQRLPDDAFPSYGSILQTIPPGTIGVCKKTAAKQKCTLFVVVLTAIALLVDEVYRNSKVLLCLASANRRLPWTSPLIGCFFTNIILSLDVRRRQSIGDLIHSVRESLLDAREKQDMPFELFAAGLGLECTSRRHPPYRIYISYRNSAHDVEFSLPNTQAELVDTPTGRNTKEDIVLNFWEKLSDGGLHLDIQWLWRTDTFDRAAIEMISSKLEALLEGLGGDIDRDVQSLRDSVAAPD